MVNKADINRNALKKDFLKQTIIRVDYDYMFDDYIERIMKNIDEFLGEKGYSIKNSFMSQFGLKVDFDKINNDLNASIMDNINIESDKREKFISFINNEKHIKIDITREYSSITIDYVEHIHFDEICIIFNKILEELKNIRKNLRIKRLGLRKINVYMLKDISLIDNYFETGVFNFVSSDLDTYEFMGKNSLDMFMYNGYKINQTANVSQGYLQNNNTSELVNQLILDFDIYTDNPLDDVSLQDMNEKIFEIYKNSLTESFLNNLLVEDYEDEGIFKI